VVALPILIAPDHDEDVISDTNDRGRRPCVRASRSSSSRKSGCAREIIAFARSGMDCFRLTRPYR
jgi:hypothetical protein